MEENKKRRGAPRKLYTEGEAPRRVHTQLKTWIYNLVPQDRPLNEILEELITVSYADKDQRDIASHQKRIQELEYELSKERIELYNLQQTQMHKEEVQRSILMQRKYIGNVLRRIIKTSFSSRKVTTKAEWYEKLYGITFDIPAMDKLLADTSISIEQLYEMSEMDLIETVSARKIGKGQKEPEIMQEILSKEEGGKK